MAVTFARAAMRRNIRAEKLVHEIKGHSSAGATHQDV